jgi:hypothetical protein
MQSSFDLIQEDFLREVGAMQQLLAIASNASTSARIASSNALILLLGATYEEFVREIIREYAGRLVSHSTLSHALPGEFVAAVWERSTYVLRGLKHGRDNFDQASARSAIRQLERFCLDGDPSAVLADTVAYNENNLRPAEFNLMFKRVGLIDYCATIGNRQEMVAFFGSPSSTAAHGRMISIMGEFYDTRNEVAHSIGSYRVAGVSDLERYIQFFICLSGAIVSDMNGRLTTPADEA